MAIFYFEGVYGSISKRVAGIKHVRNFFFFLKLQVWLIILEWLYETYKVVNKPLVLMLKSALMKRW